MVSIKENVAKVKANFIGAGLGAVTFYLGAKKYGKVSNKYALIGLSVAGLVVGAIAQQKFVAKKGAPTKEQVTAPVTK